MKYFFEFSLLLLVFNSVSCLNKEKDCKCRILPESKIVGGEKAHHLAYPWIVSISSQPDEYSWPIKRLISESQKIDFHSCGGSIINEYWILTAAHCIPENRNPTLYVGFGNDNDLVKIFDYGRVKSVRIYKYPSYTQNREGSPVNDIALIQLSQPIQFTEHVKPACFLNINERLYSGYLDHSGWGSTEVFKANPRTGEVIKPKIPRNLKEMFLVDESDVHGNCRYNEDVICAKGIKVGESSCKGDSGGPVHYTKNGKSYVVGITSYSNDVVFKDNLINLCLGSTVYTRVTSFIDWIKYHVDNDICDF